MSNTEEVSEGMLTNIKRVHDGLGWLASTRRPDVAATHSIIPSGYDRRSPQLTSDVRAVTHWSVNQDTTTFEASEGMAIFDVETRSYRESPKHKDKSGVVHDELSDEDKSTTC